MQTNEPVHLDFIGKNSESLICMEERRNLCYSQIHETTISLINFEAAHQLYPITFLDSNHTVKAPDVKNKHGIHI